MFRIAILILFIFSSFASFAFGNIDPAEWGTNNIPALKLSTLPVSPSKNEDMKQRIMNEYAVWKGTRYLWGGDSHNGIDCSAFTRRVLQQVSHQNLPRTAIEQSHRGYPVSQEQLKPGDLVFFMTQPNIRHVGVFVGNNQFIHASSSHGVMISYLSGSYWQEHYLTARRIEPERGLS
ncbi:NlpC/P60 family protein (plasmid) [Enterobacter hormaechei]|uniref:C40 family peptidase n=1 Tax=Enterobacter ludwigii TaxID=299767 RepID=UPI001BE124A5|nr:NlpC/P60 family protein [Enterobacter ludwigii]MBT1850642.1 C40 family peptidase [Enterobacter ludwigii]